MYKVHGLRQCHQLSPLRLVINSTLTLCLVSLYQGWHPDHILINHSDFLITVKTHQHISDSIRNGRPRQELLYQADDHEFIFMGNKGFNLPFKCASCTPPDARCLKSILSHAAFLFHLAMKNTHPPLPSCWNHRGDVPCETHWREALLYHPPLPEDGITSDPSSSEPYRQVCGLGSKAWLSHTAL